MNIVIFTHPTFLQSQSMPRYAGWLAMGMRNRGHRVEIWTAPLRWYRIPLPKSAKKWLGYIDQYLLFPMWAKKRLKQQSADTLFVFADHALGPWVPLVANRPHIIHCHDFLAQCSALGEFPDNPTSFTGKLYQAYIRQGYQQGKNFISVSQNTQNDLHRFLKSPPLSSFVVYNGLPGNFKPAKDVLKTRRQLAETFEIDLSNGFILHIGGNQWYKNRLGVIVIYNAWRTLFAKDLPLILIGEPPHQRLKKAHQNSPYAPHIYFLTDVNDTHVQDFYACASLFLFPSIAEGFGWPIIEAMASGCSVVTTNQPPMNEIGADAVAYIDKMPNEKDSLDDWATESAKVLESILSKTQQQQMAGVKAGLQNCKRFNSDAALDRMEKLYARVIESMS